MHWMLFDLDEHIRMMDEAGIDAAFLTSAAGMCADLDKSRLVQRKTPSRRSATIPAASSAPRTCQSARRRRGACASSTAASTSSAFPAW